VDAIFGITARPITLTVNSASKVYGNSDPSFTYAIEVAGTDRGLITGDTFSGSLARAAGRNVGNYTINQGTVANNNYLINFVSDSLVITQLSSVTYIGPAGGNWSDPNNWAGGAIPDLSNVANVLIPTGPAVTYDASVVGPVTSQVAANGALNLSNAGGAVSLGGISGSGSIELGSNNLSLTAASGGDFSGVISGTGGFTVASGAQTLSGVNTYTGNTAINSGASLILAGSGQLGGGNYAGTITNNGSFVYASSATQTISGVISGSGSLTQTALPSGSPVGTLILTAANTYTGATTVDAGTLAITNAGALGSGTAGTTVNTGGTLDLRNVTGVAEPITLAGGTLATSTGTSSVTAPISISGASTVDVVGTQLTLEGVISGSGSLEKEGSGTLILAAANTYTGATTVNAGTLAITNAGALGSGAAGTTVNTGGTLDLRNVTGVAEPITLAGGTLFASVITGQNTQVGGAPTESGVSALIGATNVISGNRATLNNGSLNETFNNSGRRSQVTLSMGGEAISSLSSGDRLGSGEFRMMANTSAIPVAERGFANIIFEIVLNGMPVQLVASSPQQGFELKLPPMVLPGLNALLMQLKDGIPESVTLTATLSNGMPLPSWLKFDPETQTFSAGAIPDGTPDLQIRLQASQNGEPVDAVTFTIDLP
jgi:autotransporter-associated beta strand protein